MQIQRQLHRLLEVKDQRVREAEQRLRQERERRAMQETELQRCRNAYAEAEAELTQFRASLFAVAVTRMNHQRMLMSVDHAEWMHLTVKSRGQDVTAATSRLAALDRCVVAAESAVQLARREREKTVSQCDVVAARVRRAVECQQGDELEQFLEISSQRARQKKA